MESPSPTPPHTLGKYQVLERLAIGGMGELFLARERGLAGFERVVVVKQLLPGLAIDQAHVDMFINEARLWAHLAHPNIVQLHDFGKESGGYFLAMEYVPGADLGRLMTLLSARQEKLPIAQALHIVIQIARALDFAHRAEDSQGRPLGIVHRDVSPQNALVSFLGDVKLTDFGIAKSPHALARGASDKVRGKRDYMAPEQWRGEDVDARADIFSVGVILWELTVGMRLSEFSSRDREAGPPAPHTIEPNYPSNLEEIVLASLAQDPTIRTPSGSSLIGQLKYFMAENGITADSDELGMLMRRIVPKAERSQRLGESELSLALTMSRSRTEALEAASVPEEIMIFPTTAPARSRAFVLRRISLAVLPVALLLGWFFLRVQRPATPSAEGARPVASEPRIVEPSAPATLANKVEAPLSETEGPKETAVAQIKGPPRRTKHNAMPHERDGKTKPHSSKVADVPTPSGEVLHLLGP